MSKLLPVIVILALLATILNYLPLKRELAYRLGISGDTTLSCCDENKLSQNGEFDETSSVAIFNNEVIDYPKTSLASTVRLASANALKDVLGTTKGDFSIWYKTRNQSMIGGSKELGTYYNLPNVPNNMFFYKGYAVHGAYWHNNFGQPMSHGCVNAPLAQVAQLFEWAGPVLPEKTNALRASADNPGTRVYVH